MQNKYKILIFLNLKKMRIIKNNQNIRKTYTFSIKMTVIKITKKQNQFVLKLQKVSLRLLLKTRNRLKCSEKSLFEKQNLQFVSKKEILYTIQKKEVEIRGKKSKKV